MNCKDTDLFYSQKNKLHRDYVEQLNKTMKYPNSMVSPKIYKVFKPRLMKKQ